MMGFLKENIVFIVSSILIVAGVITVSFQQEKTGTPTTPGSEGTPATGTQENAPATATPAASTPATPPPPSTTPTTKTTAPKPAIHGINTGEGFDD